jgi:hypothetical protein
MSKTILCRADVMLDPNLRRIGKFPYNPYLNANSDTST